MARPFKFAVVSVGLGTALITALILLLPDGLALQLSKSLMVGDERLLRERANQQPSPEPYPDLLILALDGVDRSLLYQMLRDGELPGLASLLGAQNGEFPHAHFNDRYTSVLPSSTAPAWAAAFTGQPPAVNGVPGNEYFIRSEASLKLPVGVTVDGNASALGTYNEGYFNKLLAVPTVYELMRERDPQLLIWVALQHIFAGADRLILTTNSVFLDGAQATIAKLGMRYFSEETTQALTAQLDHEILEQTLQSLAKHPAPDVLTIYLPGTDKIAHNALSGPTPARRKYLREQLDAPLQKLRDALHARNALANRYVVVVSDHGHSAVIHDKRHSMGLSFDDDPPALIKKAGFRLRPFTAQVPRASVFDSVITYQGAMAFLYVADRSSCPLTQANQPCDWQLPARYQEDVLALAETFYRNNLDGQAVPALQGALDVILVRAHQQPFVVYTGDGSTQSIADYFRQHPQPRYLRLAERLRALSSGPHGDRAGDIILVANNGNVDDPQQRFYFAAPYRSWHGSPSAQDSNIPLIVAHPQRSSAALANTVETVLAKQPSQEKLTPLLLKLRFDTVTADQ